MDMLLNGNAISVHFQPHFTQTLFLVIILVQIQGCSSIGRVADSKSVGCGFDPCHPCHGK